MKKSTGLEDYEKETASQSLLLSLGKDITTCRNKKDFMEVVHRIFHKIFPFRELTISLVNPDGLTHSAYLYNLTDETKDHPDYAQRAQEKYAMNDGVYDVVLRSEGEAVVFDLAEMVRRPFIPSYITFFYENNIREAVALPIRTNNQSIGGVFIYMEEKGTFGKAELMLAEGIASQISIAVANIQAYEKIEGQLEEIKAYKLHLEEQNLYLQEQIEITYNNSEVIGGSPEIKKVFDLVARVASTDSTVLLQGETGTGKELIARAIHNTSRRSKQLMVKVNCAALPANLIESELFGHERGSFTGATDRRIGKFELANNSTLFLDEIGEMPLELQVKLLRALQEKEIERIGGRSVIKIDTRIIAATNRNLPEEIAAGRFRKDLYYRLNVFPIKLPPLRERKEDIPVLATHFMQRLSPKLGRQIMTLSQGVLEQMIRYDWPGNIRELEHLIERSMLMATGSTLKEIFLPTHEKNQLADSPDQLYIKSLGETERDQILFVLKKSGGRVRGPGGAAELLNIPPTTLHSKMKKLGIRRSGK